MEPPAKRPRFGPAPFDDFDDPEADELNEAPEAVNARRDPAVRLERSRASALFKLKSNWEHIFEKYGKDFTGIGDEIKLSTGEIVVDNGHIQSLKNAELGGADEEDGASDDEGSQAESLNAEERAMRGTVDNRLSSLGPNAIPLMPQQIGMPQQTGTPPPSFLASRWSAPVPMFVGTPGLSSMMYPWQMPSPAGLPMQYATPIPMPATDPAWRTPELPSSSVGDALTWGQATGSVRMKTARLSLSAAREQDGVDEDDVLLGPSAAGTGGGKDQGPVVKQRVLLPRPPPEKVPGKKKRKKPEGVVAKQEQGVKEFHRPQHAGKPVNEGMMGPRKKGTATPDRTAPGSSPKPNSGANTTVEGNGTLGEPISTELAGLAAQSEVTSEGDRERDIEKDGPADSELVIPESLQATLPEPDAQLLDPAGPDVYVKVSNEGEEQGLARKPGNQTLRVEILSGSSPDVDSFRVITPNPGQADLPQAGETVADELSPKEVNTAMEIQDTGRPVPERHTASDRRQQAPAASAEVFTRNVVDSAYAFSDEDEPAIPRRRQLQRKRTKPKLTKPTNAVDAALREISQNVGSGRVSGGRGLVTDAPGEKMAGIAAIRNPSPTLSLCLEDVESRPGADHSKPLGGGRYPSRRSPVVDVPGQRSDQQANPSDQTTHRRMPRRVSTDQTGSPSFVQIQTGSSTQALESETLTEVRSDKPKGRGRPSKTRLQETPVRTSGRPETTGRDPPAQQSRQEIPETSPNAHPAVSSPSANISMDLILEASNSGPPFTSEEQVLNVPDQLDRAPSPTLTDPTSKPQPSPSLPNPPQQPPPAPRTPVRKTNRRHSRPQQRTTTPPTTTTAPKTTTTTSTTKQRKGVLSLVPADNDDDYEDELSIISPLRPATTTAVRSTPAGHHVRLGLLAPRSSGGSVSKSATVTASKLKRAVLARSAAAAGGGGGGNGFSTPSGRKRKGKGPTTPSTPRLLQEEEEGLVQTPGGTMRRCGEGGFRCEREFCFSCL